MLFTELLRVTVFLVAGVATALAAVSMIAVQQDAATFALIVAAAWWLIAADPRLLRRSRHPLGRRRLAAPGQRPHRDHACRSRARRESP